MIKLLSSASLLLIVIGCTSSTNFNTKVNKDEFPGSKITFVSSSEKFVEVQNGQDFSDDFGKDFGELRDSISAKLHALLNNKIQNAVHKKLTFVEEQEKSSLTFDSLFQFKTKDSKEIFKLKIPLYSAIPNGIDYLLVIGSLTFTRRSSFQENSGNSNYLYLECVYAILDKRNKTIISYGIASNYSQFKFAMTKSNWDSVISGFPNSLIYNTPVSKHGVVENLPKSR